MAGTELGGIKAAMKNKRLYGDDSYREIGAMGGKLGHTGGFYADRNRASLAGKLGGMISRRGMQKLTPRQNKQKRSEFHKTYRHLLKIQAAANKERQLAKLSA